MSMFVERMDGISSTALPIEPPSRQFGRVSARDNAESVNVVARALTGLGIAISDGPSLRHLLTSLE